MTIDLPARPMVPIAVDTLPTGVDWGYELLSRVSYKLMSKYVYLTMLIYVRRTKKPIPT
jgi:hypothetical protein